MSLTTPGWASGPITVGTSAVRLTASDIYSVAGFTIMADPDNAAGSSIYVGFSNAITGLSASFRLAPGIGVTIRTPNAKDIWFIGSTGGLKVWAIT